MVDFGGHRVVASNHAVEQALRRVPVLRGADKGGGSYWVEQTAARALRDGRRARRCPRWCVREWSNGFSARARLPQDGVIRFLWNETETAAMIVMKVTQAEGGPRVWLVKTVITPELAA